MKKLNVTASTSRKSVAKRPRKAVEASKPTAEVDIAAQFVPKNVALSRLILEAAQARIRHRALIETLGEGKFEWSTYVKQLKAIRERDENALVQQLILTSDAFNAAFSEWSARDFARFGYSVEKNSDAESPPE